MILSGASIASRLDQGKSLLSTHVSKALIITPRPELDDLRRGAAASVDLRLGTWFLSTRVANHNHFPVISPSRPDKTLPTSEHVLAERRHVHFGSHFILHPRRFVLAATLEWIKVPEDLCGFVTGKSSWGRLGLVIETAPGVHPGFTGCLTLELANVGEMPIELRPGLQICQLFLHTVDGVIGSQSSNLAGSRLPRLNLITADPFADKLHNRHLNGSERDS